MAEKRTGTKKPSVKQFRDTAEACGGVVSRIATALGVARKTIYEWCDRNAEYQAVLDEYKGKLLDECLKVARLTALGIPKLDSDKKVIGWKERPDRQMLRYFISTLGKKEGYGESIDITSKGESVKPDPVVIEVIDRRDQIVKPHEE